MATQVNHEVKVGKNLLGAQLRMSCRRLCSLGISASTLKPLLSTLTASLQHDWPKADLGLLSLNTCAIEDSFI